MQNNITKWIIGSLTVACMTLTGCAKTPDRSANDPLEGYNRAMFAFNQDVDHLVIRPAAIIYDKVTPPVLQSGITNVFHNIDEISTFGNDFLQGNFKYMLLDFWRFTINTTLGVGGLCDVASHMGLQTHVESFTWTLAKWRGGKSSPYFVIPILGPSTIQGTMGLFGDYYMTPFPYLSKDINYSVTGIRLMHTRAKYLPADKMVKNAFNPYVFVRDAHMQTVKRQIAQNQTLPPLK